MTRTGQPSPRARLSPIDLADEAVSAILQRPLRSALTALGTVLGVGAFIATLGLSTTAGAQVGARFDALKATEVTVQDTRQDPAAPFPFPADTDERLGRLNGVKAAGPLWSVDVGKAQIGVSWVEHERDAALDVAAASPGALKALRMRIRDGRSFDRFHNDRGERVALLGAGAARELGIRTVRTQPGVLVGSVPFTAIGIIVDFARRPELLRAVIIPSETALDLWGAASKGAASVVIDTTPGAAQLIGRQAPRALRPDHPSWLSVQVPPDPRGLRRGVESDLGMLVVALAAVGLIIGTVGIANTTLVSVMERVSEIGLRRAVGAGKHHIAGQFLGESAVLGTLGGVAGTCIGVIGVTCVAAARDWSPVIEPMHLLAAPLVGTLTGVLAGLYPALKASRIEPVEALRRAA